MTAVLKTWWTFFTVLPVQRVLAYIGIAGFALGVGFTLPRALEGQPAGVAALAIATLGVFVLFPAIFIAGPLFRLISAPRPHRFLPHFRVRMLAALLLFVGGVTVVISTAIWLAAPAERWSIDSGLIMPFVFVGLIVLGTFAGSGSPLGALAVILSTVVLMNWAAGGGTARLEARGIDLTPWFAIASGLAWLVFSVWYLRARRIRTINMDSFSIDRMFDSPAESAALRAPVRLRTDITRDDAARIWTEGTPQKPIARQVSGVLLAAIVVLLIVRYISAGARQPHELPLFGAVAGAMFSPLLFLIVNRLARRSRYLWLRVPASRVELLRVVERIAAKQCVLLGLLVVSVAVGAPFVIPDMSFAQGLAVLVITLSGGAYAFCAGLALVTEKQLPGIAALLVLIGSQCIAGAVILIEPFGAGWFVGVIAFHVLAALLLRMLAIRNWRRIDWLKFKPIRIASQASRS